jgi:hypothetical protein
MTLSGWATQNELERFEYAKNLDEYSEDELKSELMFHKSRSATFERQKEYWRKEHQKISIELYKCEEGNFLKADEDE